MNIQTPRLAAVQGAGFSTSSRGTAVTAGSANAKGGYIQMAASTTYPVCGLWLYIEPSSSETHALDISIGTAGSETVIVPDIFFGLIGYNSGAWVYVPVEIPISSRVAVRVQAPGGSDIVYVHMALESGDAPSFGRFTQYGYTTASTSGITVDPGATINTKGAYAQITSSTTYDMSGFILCIAGDSGNQLSWRGAIDVAIGAAASEIIIQPDIMIRGKDYGGLTWYLAGPFYKAIPAGQRIAVRMQSDNATAIERVIYATILGFR